MTNGNDLKKFRMKKRWSQKKLAEKMQVSLRSIVRWEKGADMSDLSRAAFDEIKEKENK